MALFEGLSDKLKKVFASITSRGKLNEVDIKQAMREIRIALLEADVNFNVVKDFIAQISAEAVGEKILKSLTPGQQVVKLVNEHLIKLLGTDVSKLEISSKPPTIIMMCGLQGAGKTTMCGKLALHLRKSGKKPILAACDIYRPAAIEQLKTVAKSVSIEVFEKGTQSPVKTATQAVAYAIDNNFDTLIIDTAGRLHIDQTLMAELAEIKKAVNPTEILLVVDSMTGQDAVTVATEFNNLLNITGVVLTKLDGDTRGGAALSIRAVTNKPIKFCGIGEKLSDIEPFYPDRIASRILGMGDVLTLIEKAQTAVDADEMAKLEKKFLEASFTLDDFLKQLESLKKMGSISQLVGMLPQMGNQKISEKDIDENRLARFKAIIQSMTMRERNNPNIIKASHRKRIALGSGTTIQDVNQLLKQFEQTREMLKSMRGKGGMGNMGKKFGMK